MKRTFVVVNAASGGGSGEALASRLSALFESAGMSAEILLASGADISSKVSAAIAQNADLIVAGGGDGTISAVASALVDTDIELGVLPLGTLNHFAKDLGLPLDLDSAVAAIASGRSIRVDVGEVNGHVFINNSSLGLYADIVHHREQQQRRLGRGKWPALAWASVAALRRYPFLNVSVTLESKEYLRRTPFVFIGNNEYEMEGFALGERKTLDKGQLSFYIAQRPGRWRLVQLAMRALVGRLKQARDFDVILGREFVVKSRHRRLRVALDGEIAMMSPPLRYRIRPASLIVVGTALPADFPMRVK
jgi:diacylglycerol kinase family enzyme